ncbi:MacB family efflux pump subunit [Curvibacter sp. HBC61]|uniref:Pyoverdine export ATP-binding/permease protein PvdT n=1 Tax=Curvibacter cyanobacteriorum TaxID=3026422 RepID=A0ABT5MWA5_9BURK|nr:MacB family efflux pump subunit [Curvibacter sp. HBC61]MDD0837576.1 MacB family efflux pump subunit [Curvibacter sp. HBC61]
MRDLHPAPRPSGTAPPASPSAHALNGVASEPPSAAATPLLSLQGVWREFPVGDGVLAVLKDVHLDIAAGEMIAIVGQSGSGKSTLMNLIGCLDQPSRGSYRIAGREVGSLLPDELAALRRGHFGFIFQRYHLLGDLSAAANVEVPAIYAGRGRPQRKARAQALLERLGLGGRTDHVPGKLSGGQQQRVSIARALMNGGSVILADEPTGALDTQAGAEVMKILGELNALGHTIILVTHDLQVARHARRIVTLRDGVVVSDDANTPVVGEGAAPGAPATAPVGATQAQADPAQAEPPAEDPKAVASSEETEAVPPSEAPGPAGGRLAAVGRWFDRFGEAFRMALLAMNAHRLRTLLTMLGIIIGIASVVSVVALGEGSRRKVLANISSIGTNTIDVYSGTSFGDPRSARIQTLRPSDADALSEQSYVDSVTPNVQSALTARFANVDASVQVSGVGEQYFRVKGLSLAQGTAFSPAAVQAIAQVAVIDDNARKKLFPTTDPVGQVLLLGSMPVTVIGVTAKRDSFGPNAESLNVYVPYTTAMRRLIGQGYLRSITVRVDDGTPMAAAEQGIQQLMERRHGRVDFYVLNTDSIRQTIENTTRTMTLLVSSIAVISLIVGGIGVMNIMLVSVTERTGEIGVRMAVGARQSDIQQQFLIEAVLVCLLGGVLGILAALGFGAVFSRLSSSFTIAFSPLAMAAAFVCSTLIGVVFGYLPARAAARLNPIEALARD